MTVLVLVCSTNLASWTLTSVSFCPARNVTRYGASKASQVMRATGLSSSDPGARRYGSLSLSLSVIQSPV